MTEEQAVLRRVQQGDSEAFSQLVTAYEKQVYNLCLRMVTNPEDAQDLAQEAFLKAWRGLSFYKAESSFSTWLYRLTTNVCIDFLRKRKRSNTVSLSNEDEGEAWELELPDPAPTPEQQLEYRDQEQAVAHAMAQLDEEYRTILTLRVVQDLPYEQIADVMNMKIGTVKSRLARARIKLKNFLLQSGNYFEADSSKSAERGEMRHDM